MNQDFVAWCGQGPIADRTQELLGPSDRGIVAIRRRFLEELDAVAAGAEPKAIVRDPAANESISLPIIGREQLTVGLTREQFEQRRIVYRRADFPEGYIFQYGQPEAVAAEHRAAMGLDRPAPSEDGRTANDAARRPPPAGGGD
jgi:5,5'-dehydrodivanillate O-demethylase